MPIAVAKKKCFFEQNEGWVITTSGCSIFLKALCLFAVHSIVVQRYKREIGITPIQ